MTHPNRTPQRRSLAGRALAVICLLGLVSAGLPAAASAATSPTVAIASLTASATSGTVDTSFVFTVTTNAAATVVTFTSDDPLGGVYITKDKATNAPGSTVNLAKTVWTFKTLLKPGTRVLTFTAYDATSLPSLTKTLTITVKGMLLVGVGESYGSGLGVPPYQNDGTNCGRSAGAFTRLLDADTSLAVPLVIPGNGVIDGFQDCRGSVAANVLDSVRIDTEKGINAKIKQFGPEVLSLIGTYPTLVVMTMGGNDAFFEDYMRCLAKSSGKDSDITCEPILKDVLAPGLTGTELFSDAAKINLRARLADVYNRMLDAKPNIKILVVGYPTLVKNEPNVNVCGILSGTRGRLYNLGTSLNSKISQAVADSAAKAGHAGRIFYLDQNGPGSPWAGHDLCSANPYFTKLTLPVVASYHPNAAGQQAYETLIKTWIAGHAAELTR